MLDVWAIKIVVRSLSTASPRLGMIFIGVVLKVLMAMLPPVESSNPFIFTSSGKVKSAYLHFGSRFESDGGVVRF